MQTLTVILWGLIALGLLVFVHELGHFLIAKAAGIRVLKFSLGFGSRLVGFRRGETEYLISWLPLGGYVKMAGELPEAGKVALPGDYLAKPWWVRLLVLVGGPGANLLASALVLGTLFWTGFNVPLARPQVVAVSPGTPAAAASLMAGDVIAALEGAAVDDWEKFGERLGAVAQASAGKPLVLTIERRGRTLTQAVAPAWDAAQKRWRLGVSLAPAGTTVIDRVLVGTPAETAGLRAGDRVLAVDGQAVWSKFDFQNLIWPHAARAALLSIERGQERLEVAVTPMAQQLPGQGKIGVIGVNFKSSVGERRVHYPFLEAYALGFRQTGGLIQSIWLSLGQMISGQVAARDAVGGPITIMRMAGQEARSGLADFLFFLAGISVMLGILNLLPIPILDGGTAVLFILEGVLGRPISLRWQEGLQRVGFALLLALMIFATYNDIYKLLLPVFTGR